MTSSHVTVTCSFRFIIMAATAVFAALVVVFAGIADAARTVRRVVRAAGARGGGETRRPVHSIRVVTTNPTSPTTSADHAQRPRPGAYHGLERVERDRAQLRG